MLYGISPLISLDLLYVLRAMGHGDEIAIVDANFPAAAMDKPTIRESGVSATEMVGAILSLLPIDTFDGDAVFSMAVVGDASQKPDIVKEFEKTIDGFTDFRGGIAPLERHEFYGRAQKAFAIVVTGERRLYGNLIIRKGIIEP